MTDKEVFNQVDFILKNCEVHGRFGDKVYSKKRNGKPRVYDYKYKNKYSPTVLTRRNKCIINAVKGISNPHKEDYSSLMSRVYYYTPYFVYSGSYDFSCNTFLKLREKGVYRVKLGGCIMNLHLSPRSKISYVFEDIGEHLITCCKGEKFYCQRKVIVIAAGEDLEETYSRWFAKNLKSVLKKPKPEYGSLKLYRRYIETTNPLFTTFSGKIGNCVLCRNSKRERTMYIRQQCVHKRTSSGDHFYESLKSLMKCWKATCDEFSNVWDNYRHMWNDANFDFKNYKILSKVNLWSKVLFRVCKEIGIDPVELSVDNWLEGVKTLGDLLGVAGFEKYALTKKELSTRIY